MKLDNVRAIVQTGCVVMVSCGILIEIYYGADLGFALITGGGLAFGVSTKINDRLKKNNKKGGDNHGS